MVWKKEVRRVRDRQAAWIGSRLYQEGLVTANFGNLSYRHGEGFYIKRKGEYLDPLGDLVFVPLDGEVPADASREWIVHRAIYCETPHQAIIHAHPVHAIAISFGVDEVLPQDCEGELVCPRIPVVTGASGSTELAQNVAAALADAPVVIVRGHGTFAAASTLEGAYVATSAVEHACRILLLLKGIQNR